MGIATRQLLVVNTVFYTPKFSFPKLPESQKFVSFCVYLSMGARGQLHKRPVQRRGQALHQHTMPYISFQYLNEIMQRIDWQDWMQRIDSLQNSQYLLQRAYDAQTAVLNGLEADFDGQGRTIVELRAQRDQLRMEVQAGNERLDNYQENAQELHTIQDDLRLRLADAMASKKRWQCFSFLLALCLLACVMLAYFNADQVNVLTKEAYQRERQVNALIEYLLEILCIVHESKDTVCQAGQPLV